MCNAYALWAMGAGSGMQEHECVVCLASINQRMASHAKSGSLLKLEDGQECVMQMCFAHKPACVS